MDRDSSNNTLTGIPCSLSVEPVSGEPRKRRFCRRTWSSDRQSACHAWSRFGEVVENHWPMVSRADFPYSEPRSKTLLPSVHPCLTRQMTCGRMGASNFCQRDCGDRKLWRPAPVPSMTRIQSSRPQSQHHRSKRNPVLRSHVARCDHGTATRLTATWLTAASEVLWRDSIQQLRPATSPAEIPGGNLRNQTWSGWPGSSTGSEKGNRIQRTPGGSLVPGSAGFWRENLPARCGSPRIVGSGAEPGSACVFQFPDLVQPQLVPSAFELGCQPDMNQFVDFRISQGIAGQTEDVGIIVPAAELG